MLEKLIAYEAVHEIKGWDDLRRRLAPDRRCFAFFHPALPGEPLIFVEVALVRGAGHRHAAAAVARTRMKMPRRAQAERADTAIFYSISNCQDGLRGVSFGNFLIKQVVEELQAEFPQTEALLHAVAGAGFSALARPAGSRMEAIPMPTLLPEAETDGWWHDPAQSEKLRPGLMRLCARYLTRPSSPGSRIDPVARFHLGNGARLERINWLGDTAPRAIDGILRHHGQLSLRP